MEKLDKKELNKKGKANPLFKGMPVKLKDPKNFEKIERELFIVLQTDHKHKTVKAYVTCAWCNKKRELWQNKIKSFGFNSYEQYHEWKKIMTIIKNKANFQIQ